MNETTQAVEVKTTYGGKQQNVDFVLFEFDIEDAKGRRIGVHVKTYEVDFVEASEGQYSSCNLPVGHYFALNCHATRDGASYGAYQKTQFFTSEAERSEALEKYLANAKKRAAKKSGK